MSDSELDFAIDHDWRNYLGLLGTLIDERIRRKELKQAPRRARLTWLGNFLDRYCSAFDGFEAPFMFGSALSILLAVHMWVAVFIPWLKAAF